MKYAKVGIRFAAVIIDGIIFGAISYVVAMFTGGVTETGFQLTGVPALIVMLLALAYSIVMEATIGATVGKLATGLRVVQADSGGKISWQASIIRNILRIVDFLPLFYILGAILVWTSEKGQRLGDRVAKTVVIRK